MYLKSLFMNLTLSQPKVYTKMARETIGDGMGQGFSKV